MGPEKLKRKCFYCKSGQTLEEAAQRGCGVYIRGDLQKSTGHSPDKPNPPDPALSMELD